MGQKNGSSRTKHRNATERLVSLTLSPATSRPVVAVGAHQQDPAQGPSNARKKIVRGVDCQIALRVNVGLRWSIRTGKNVVCVKVWNIFYGGGKKRHWVGVHALFGRHASKSGGDWMREIFGCNPLRLLKRDPVPPNDRLLNSCMLENEEWNGNIPSTL